MRQVFSTKLGLAIPGELAMSSEVTELVAVVLA